MMHVRTAFGGRTVCGCASNQVPTTDNLKNVTCPTCRKVWALDEALEVSVSFVNKETAFRFADGCKNIHVVLLGDNNRFWVVDLRRAAVLVEAGYEEAER